MHQREISVESKVSSYAKRTCEGLFYCEEDGEKKQVIYLSVRQSVSQKREPILASTFSANEWAWETGARSKFLYDKIADIPEIAEFLYSR